MALAAERPLRAAVAALEPVELGEDERELGDPARMASSVNTPADLAAAERLLAARGRA